MKTFNLLLLICLTILVSCSKMEDETPIVLEEDLPMEAEAMEDTTVVASDTTYIEYGEYGPFGVGSTWSYRYVHHTSSDMVVENDSVPPSDSSFYFYKIENEKDTIVDGLQLIKQSRKFYHNNFEEEPYQVNYSYLHISGGKHYSASVNEGEILLQKYFDSNAVIGYEWVNDTIVSETNNMGTVYSIPRYKIADKYPSFEVDGVVYKDVVKIIPNNTDIIQGQVHNIPSLVDMYYAKGVGFIFYDHYPPAQRKQSKLLSYEIVPN